MPDTSPAPALLTVSDIAGRLRLSRPKVYRLVESGELTAHRFGRAVRIAPADLESYLSRCRTVGPAA